MANQQVAIMNNQMAELYKRKVKMIDWVTAKMPCQNTLNTGFVAKVEPCGRIEWVSQSWLPVQGSHDSNIVIKPMTDNTQFKFRAILQNGFKVIIFLVQMI